MRGVLAFLSLLVYSVAIAADQGIYDENEVRLHMSIDQPTDADQAMLRQLSGWENWNQYGWMTIMSERTGLPHRAWGAGLEFDGNNIETKHLNFVESTLPFFGISQDQIAPEFNKNRSPKHDRIFQTQEVDGYEVLLSKLQTKWRDGKLVLFGLDWWADAQVPEGDLLTENETL